MRSAIGKRCSDEAWRLTDDTCNSAVSERESDVLCGYDSVQLGYGRVSRSALSKGVLWQAG